MADEMGLGKTVEALFTALTIVAMHCSLMDPPPSVPYSAEKDDSEMHHRMSIISRS